MARTQNAELLNTLQAGFKYIQDESFESTFDGLFSEIDLASPKLGKTYADRNAKLCTIIQKIAEGLNEFSTDVDALGDSYEYRIGQFAAGSGKNAGEFYTPQQMSDILSAIVTLNISRYISTAVGEVEIDLKKTHSDLLKIEKTKAADKHNTFLKELGLPLLP
jgi:type I restriction enzyme M protein